MLLRCRIKMIIKTANNCTIGLPDSTQEGPFTLNGEYNKEGCKYINSLDRCIKYYCSIESDLEERIYSECSLGGCPKTNEEQKNRVLSKRETHYFNYVLLHNSDPKRLCGSDEEKMYDKLFNEFNGKEINIGLEELLRLARFKRPAKEGEKKEDYYSLLEDYEIGWKIRERAIKQIGDLKDKRAIPVLKNALWDSGDGDGRASYPKWYTIGGFQVELAAVEALTKIGGVEAKKAIEKRLSEFHTYSIDSEIPHISLKQKMIDALKILNLCEENKNGN